MTHHSECPVERGYEACACDGYRDRDELQQKLDTMNAENVSLKQQVQSAEGLTETFKATLKETELQVRAYEDCLRRHNLLEDVDTKMLTEKRNGLQPIEES